MNTDPLAVELGPAAMAGISDAVDSLLPWLTRGRYTVHRDGNLELTDPEAAEAVHILRARVEEVIPPPARDTLGERSGLGWNIFFGHVVAWWLPMRRRFGFLRALENRAEVHRVPLQLHWNKGREVSVRHERPGTEALIYGGIGGAIAGFGITRLWPGDPILALLALGAGVVLGRISQRVLKRRFCGDPLCRAPLGRAKVCSSCGGTCADR